MGESVEIVQSQFLKVAFYIILATAISFFAAMFSKKMLMVKKNTANAIFSLVFITIILLLYTTGTLLN